MIQKHDSYPGSNATAHDFFRLAAEYQRAADALIATHRPKHPLSQAPYRQVAIHAIELYLGALLVCEGLKPCDLRAFHHDLSARTGHERAAGIKLRKRTTQQLTELSDRREYLISRYGADRSDKVSPINQIDATLKDVRKKVERRLKDMSATKCATGVASANPPRPAMDRTETKQLRSCSPVSSAPTSSAPARRHREAVPHPERARP